MSQDPFEHKGPPKIYWNGEIIGFVVSTRLNILSILGLVGIVLEADGLDMLRDEPGGRYNIRWQFSKKWSVSLVGPWVRRKQTRVYKDGRVK